MIYPIKYCYDAAHYILKKDFSNRQKVEQMYDHLVERKEFMENARKGFYCMVCSLEGQEAIYTRKRLKMFGKGTHVNYH